MHDRRLALPAILVALAGIVAAAPRAEAQGGVPGSQSVIRGTVFLDTVSRNNRRDPGEPAVPGVTVELWHTTSFAGVPLRIRSTQTNVFGQYQFLVDPINGPLPDFGCYQVRAQVPSGLGGGVQNSPELCQVTPGGAVTANFALAPGGGTNPPPGGSQAGFFGKVFRETVRRNFLQEPGEPGVPGATVEVWSTTSITGLPSRITSTQTDAQGRYQLVVSPINGPLPDLGCYEVRLVLPASIGGSSVIRSEQFCRLAPGQRQELDFPLAGGVTIPPPTGTNRPPAALYIQADSGVAPGGVIRVQALGIEPEDDCLTYSWSASGGRFVALEGSLADWQAPTQPGQYRILARVTDPQGRTLVGQVTVTVASGRTFNHAPNLDEIVASDITPAPGQVVQLTARGSDPDRHPLTNWFHFYNALGSRVGPFDVLWQAPSRPGIYRTYGIVYDNQGGYGFNIRELSVNSAQALNRSHPSYGQAGQLLIESYGRLLWVGINDPQVAQQAAALANAGAQRWVIGRVVPDSTQRHCFYLNPATVSLAEITIEGMQTTIEQVSRRPAYFAPGGGSGFDAWAISARLIEFVPAQ